jgi:protein O-mannosyl-transferase
MIRILEMNKRVILFVILLAAIVLGLYFNIFHNEPTNWDDPGLILHPERYILTPDNIKRIFTITSTSTYQPVRDFSYVIDYTISSGNFVHAAHIHSIILYFLQILATWLFLLELFKAFSVNRDKASLWAGISTLIFAVHPVHVEAVAWLYARKEPLLGLFTMLCFWTFLKARMSPFDALIPSKKTGNISSAGEHEKPKPVLSGWVYLLLSFVFMMLAVLSKPTALVAPLFMIVLDICLQLHKPQKKYWVRRGVFFLAAFIVVLPLSLWLVSMLMNVGGVKPYHGGTFWSNLLAVSQIFIEYISLYAATLYFSADYPIKLYTGILQWQAWIYLFLNIGLVGFAVYALITCRYLITIFIMLHYIFILPVSHFFPINNILADRYAMIPSLSWCVLLGWILSTLWNKRLANSRLSADFPRLVAVVIMFAIMISYSYMTYSQTFVWRNSAVLWEHTLRKYPNSSSANDNMAAVLINSGEYNLAIKLCLNAILDKPYDYIAISNMAFAQMRMKDYKNSIYNYKVALNFKPDLTNAEIGLANCYLETNDIKNAYNLLKKITDNGDFSKVSFGALLYSKCALASWKMGKKDEAAKFLNIADISKVTDMSVLQEIALTATSMGDKTLAVSSYKKLLPILKNPKKVVEIQASISKLETSDKRP